MLCFLQHAHLCLFMDLLCPSLVFPLNVPKVQPGIFQKAPEMVNFDASEPVVIIGFGQMGQVH